MLCENGGAFPELQANAAAPALFSPLVPGMIYQNLTHGPGAYGEEMGPPFPIDLVLANELEIGFMDQSRRLQGVVRGLPPKIGSRQGAQFIVNERHQTVGGRSVPRPGLD